MKTNQPVMDYRSKFSEAEAYYSMGLFSEALDAYRQVVPAWEQLDSSKKKVIRLRLKELIEKLHPKKSEQEIQEVSSDEINMIKAVITKERPKDTTDLFETARAFVENGLFAEAINEYFELLSHGYAPEIIVPEVVTCLFEAHKPDQVETEIQKIVSRMGDSISKRSETQFAFGEEVLKKGYDTLAVRLIKTATVMAPENTLFQGELDKLLLRRDIYRQYDGLLRTNRITRERLKRAVSRSEKSGRSVAFFLVEHDKVSKDDVLRCLAEFYGCPFDIFNADTQPPVDIMGSLSEFYLKEHCWVPLRGDTKSADILISDPHNTSLLNDAKERLKTKKINVILGLKEDIEHYIEHYYTSLKRYKKTASADEQPKLIDLTQSKKKKRLEESTDTTFKPGDFISARFALPGQAKNEEHVVKVIEHANYGLGLLIDENAVDLTKQLNPGDSIKDIYLFTQWAMLNVDVSIKNMVKITAGEHRNNYFLGIESNELP